MFLKWAAFITIIDGYNDYINDFTINGFWHLPEILAVHRSWHRDLCTEIPVANKGWLHITSRHSIIEQNIDLFYFH